MTNNPRGHSAPATGELLLAHVVDAIAQRVVVFSGKGGVGKTTVAVNLAFTLAARGRRVGLLDADLTGPNVAQMSGVKGPARGSGDRILPHEIHGVKIVSLASMLPEGAPVIWRGPMRSKVIEQLLEDTDWGTLDVLVVDLPPGTGDEVLTVVQRIGPQTAVVVTTPQEVARADARRAVGFAKQLGIAKIGLLENMSGLICPHCGQRVDVFGADQGASEAASLGVRFLGSVPLDPTVPGDGDAGRPVVVGSPKSLVARALQDLASALEDWTKEPAVAADLPA
ncbi:MAG: Mrp/NBP35 family ATP-binding protein [Candidatus Bipolaricaulota bacterium]